MTIPLYVPGTALAVSAAVSFVLGATIPDPSVAGTWSDRGTILSILVFMFISWAVILRYVAGLHREHLNATVGAINENTSVTRRMATSLDEHLEFQRRVAQKAITDRLEVQTPHRTRVHTSRVQPRDHPNHLPTAEDPST